MGNRICVDTDIIIDHLRGRNPNADLYARIITEEQPYTTYITKFELLCGVKNRKEESVIKDALLSFTVLPFDGKSSREAAKIYRSLSSKGRLIGMRDILIAGIACANDMPLATRNIREFERVIGLNIWKASKRAAEIKEEF